MSFAYRIKVHNQSGTLRDTFTPSDKLGDLGQFDVDSLGVCGDASFSILPTAVEINPRDIVLLETSNDGGSTYSPLYLGMVVETPNPRSDSLGAVRCVGLKQRFYEIVIDIGFIDGGDVATMFADGVAGISRPAGAGGVVSFSSSDAPTLTFELGDRYPKYETFGNFADELARTVGAFVVPTGNTYVYDGETFSAGSEVPLVRWGVRADNSLIFRRDVTAPLSFAESDIDVDITWLNAQAEEVVNSVNLIYATQFDLDLMTSMRDKDQSGIFFPAAHPIARTFDSIDVVSFTNINRVSRNVTIKDPLLFMTQIPLTLNQTVGSWTDIPDALDDNPSTYAESGGAINDLYAVEEYGQGILVIRYASPYPLRVTMFVRTTGFVLVGILVAVLPRTLDINSPSTVALLIAEPQVNKSYTPAPWPFLSLAVIEPNEPTGSLKFRLHLIQAFVPDVDVGTTNRDALLAETFFTKTLINASTVRVTGIETTAAKATIDPLVGSALNVAIERVSYSITREGGAQTTYYVDQAFPAGEEAEKVLLERLARRAVAEGGARR